MGSDCTQDDNFKKFVTKSLVTGDPEPWTYDEYAHAIQVGLARRSMDYTVLTGSASTAFRRRPYCSIYTFPLTVCHEPCHWWVASSSIGENLTTNPHDPI